MCRSSMYAFYFLLVLINLLYFIIWSVCKYISCAINRNRIKYDDYKNANMCPITGAAVYNLDVCIKQS